jgi:hypothetical protein
MKVLAATAVAALAVPSAAIAGYRGGASDRARRASPARPLSINVPHHVHKHQTYAIRVHGGPSGYAMIAIDFSGRGCPGSAQAEWRGRHRPQQWIGINVRYHGSSGAPGAPEGWTRRFVAESTGHRRACVWVYPTKVNPRSTTRPLGRQGAAYDVSGGAR